MKRDIKITPRVVRCNGTLQCFIQTIPLVQLVIHFRLFTFADIYTRLYLYAHVFAFVHSFTLVYTCLQLFTHALFFP